MRQGLNVMVCSSTDGATCNNSTTWATGWLVMLPTGGGCTASNGLTASTILRRTPALSSGDAVTLSFSTGSSTSKAVCYSRLGTANLGGGSNVVKLTVATATSTASPSQFNKQCLFVANAGPVHLVRYGVTDTVGNC